MHNNNTRFSVRVAGPCQIYNLIIALNKFTGTTAPIKMAHNTTAIFTCRGRVPYPAWYVDEIVLILPPRYTVDYEPSTGDFLGVLVIDGNKTVGTLDLSCEVERQTAYTIRLTIEGL